MTRFFFIVNILGVVVLAVILVYLIRYNDKAEDYLEQRRLMYQIKQATDAGAWAMLTTDTLDTDYHKTGFVSVNPNQALDAFLSTFAVGYDMMPSAENKALIKQYIPAAAIAAYDGYYIGTQRITKSDNNVPEATPKNIDQDFVFGPKLPYTYSSGTVKYGLTIDGAYSHQIVNGNLTQISGVPEGADVRKVVNQSISDDMAYTIDSFNQSNPNWSHKFFIPSQFSEIKATNPIKGPSFIVMVEGVDFSHRRPISAFSLSGAKIDKAHMIAGYIRNGIKYYTYVEKMPAGATLQNIYSSPKQAAKDGYYADQQYLY